MRSLFAKIFLWFWLAMTSITVASLLLAVTTESHPLFAPGWLRFLVQSIKESRESQDSRSSAGRWMRVTEGALKLSGHTAAEIFERNGLSAFSSYVGRIERSTRIRLFFLDDRNKEVSGRPLPEAVEELGVEVWRSGESELRRSGGYLLLAHRVRGPSMQKYVIVGRLPDRRFGLFSYEPYELLMHLAAILFTAGVVCYWLARYITSPIHKLQTATRRIAGGDLTVRVGAELGNRKDEIADLGAAFDIMASRIKSLMSAQHRLLQDISHELRSPLARLGIALELARQSEGAEAHAALDRIEREAGRLNELIQRLLVVSRLESEEERIKMEPLPLVRLLEEIASDAEIEAQSRNCSIRIIAEKESAVLGSEDLLRSAFENIVRNAVSYTAEGTEVEITVESKEEADEKITIIEVKDHGPGVPEEALSDLFRPFYRVGEARDRTRGGVGLGLSIAERAIKLHGGAVAASNAPDGGLVVSVRLRATGMDAQA